MQDPRVLQEEAQGVPTLVPVLGTVTAAQSGEHSHRGVRIFGVIQVGSIWRTFLESKEMILFNHDWAALGFIEVL